MCVPMTLGDEHHADQQQEAEGQHFHRRMPLDEAGDRAGKDHHHADRENHGGDHHPDRLGHADGGDAPNRARR